MWKPKCIISPPHHLPSEVLELLDVRASPLLALLGFAEPGREQ